MRSDLATRQRKDDSGPARLNKHDAAAKFLARETGRFRDSVLRSSRLGALLYPEEALKELDMGARGRLQREIRT
jgi:hypothetical protein